MFISFYGHVGSFLGARFSDEHIWIRSDWSHESENHQAKISDKTPGKWIAIHMVSYGGFLKWGCLKWKINCTASIAATI